MKSQRHSVGLIYWLSACLCAAAQDTCPDDGSLCGKAHLFHARAEQWPQQLLDQDQPGQTRESPGDTDLLHCDLEITLTPAPPGISGHNTMTVQSLVDGLNEFTFMLRSNFTITAVLLNGATSIPPASVQSVGVHGRRVMLDRPYSAGEEFTLRIEYFGAPVSLGFGSIEFRTQDGAPLIFSLSEPYYAATWWPVKDGDAFQPGDNKDKFTIDVAIVAPANLTSLSNGLLMGVDDLGAQRRFRWSSAYPIPAYLVFFSSALYNTWSTTYSHPGGTMPVEFAIFPSNDSPANRSNWQRCVQMLATLGDVYGIYPFVDEKYGIYNFGFSGGMEHQTYTGQSGFGESLTAHELGHQWWGDAVTCRTWHDIWLNEGFATYTEALWAERKPGSSGFPAYQATMNGRRPAEVGDSVYVYNTNSVGRMFNSTYTYRKAAWVLHMLRHVVGDATFFQILAEYRATFEGGAATTADFSALASTVAARDLTRFFDQWIYQIGAPVYQVGWRNVLIAGSPFLQLSIRQLQSAAYPVFEMPIDVRIDRNAGESTVVVQNAAALQHYLIPLSAAATNVTLDEFDWILNVGKSTAAYVEGPAKIVSAVPLPGAVIPARAAPQSIRVQFSESVAITPADVSVVGPGGAVPVTLTYDGPTAVATLSFDSPLPPGSYAATIAGSVRTIAANVALDGEIIIAPVVFPTGDGLPGGDAHWSFSIRPACPGDLNDDFAVNLQDLAIILSNFGTLSGATAMQGDSDADGDVDLQDLASLLATFGAACP